MKYSSAATFTRELHAYLQFTVMLVIMFSCVEASPVLVPRAIVRPIPMPGFNVSVFDDTTGTPVPQADASDGGGLISGRVSTAPNIIWAIAATVIGMPLGVAGVKLWRITTGLGAGLSIAFAMWAAVVNTISETGLGSSQSMSDMLILLLTGAAFFVGAIAGAFRIAVLPAMGATCAIGGVSIATRAVILRPGLLVPPGLNLQLAFVNIVIVGVGALCGGLSVVFNQRGSMIFATASVGSFLIALTIDLLVNGQSGMSRGLRFLYDMNGHHLADLVGGGYTPPLSSQIIVASSLGLIPVFSLFQHLVFKGPFQQPRARDRILSIAESTDKKQSYSLPNPTIAPGPTSRLSVLSIFRVPGRSPSGINSKRQSTNVVGVGLGSFGRQGPFKPANERRGSAAYNFATGVFTLPSEFMRRQESNRNRAADTAPVPRQLQLPSSRWDGSPNPAQRPRPAVPALREDPGRFNGTPYGYGYGAPGPPPVTTLANPIGVPNPAVTGRFERAATDSRYPPLDYQLRMPPGPLMRDTSPMHVEGPLTSRMLQPPGTLPVPRQNPPAVDPAAQHLPAPTNDFVPGSTPRMGIGLGMLRMSVDSILDAYGGTTDSGYRYGGSRAGEAGRI